MGAGDSKTKKGKKNDKDDGCIGNRRVRTIILSLLLVVFGVLGLAYVFEMQEYYADLNELQENVPDDMKSEWIQSGYNGWSCIAAGIFITIIGAICAIVLFFIPGCEDNLGRVSGFILIVGGVLYVIGWFIIVSAAKAELTKEYPIIGSKWDAFPDETKTKLDAGWAAKIGEALLFGGSAVLLGIDALLHWFDDEAKRLSSNLGILMAVALLTANAYYLQICGEDELLCVEPDGVAGIATGYVILFFTCLAYIVLYICTCCTCNCKDACLVRVIIGVALCIGGVLCAIGYYVMVGGMEDANSDDTQGKVVAFYIGYSVLIAGLPIVWALDIAMDDVKNNTKK
eukprot:1654_1